MYDNVIVPINLGAKKGAMALEEAIDVARSMDAKLHIITVVTEGRKNDDGIDSLVEQREEFIDKAIEMADQSLDEDEYTIVDRFGSPDTEISQLAEELEEPVIVMSTRGRSGVYLLAIGSTTWKTIREAPCPVLTLTPDIKEN